MRTASAVGDLHSPFYGEERARDVWNEASAVGFQLMLWLSMIAANLMAWAGGSDGIPHGLTTQEIVGGTSIVGLTVSFMTGLVLAAGGSWDGGFRWLP